MMMRRRRKIHLQLLCLTFCFFFCESASQTGSNEFSFYKRTNLYECVDSAMKVKGKLNLKMEFDIKFFFGLCQKLNFVKKVESARGEKEIFNFAREREL